MELSSASVAAPSCKPILDRAQLGDGSRTRPDSLRPSEPYVRFGIFRSRGGVALFKICIRGLDALFRFRSERRQHHASLPSRAPAVTPSHLLCAFVCLQAGSPSPLVLNISPRKKC